jgi:tetratricopeptide (TPR) repeat protein
MIAMPTETTGTARHGSSTEDGLATPSLGLSGDSGGGQPREVAAARDSSYEEIAAWLQNEAERLFTQGQYGAAEQKVRQLLDLQNQVVGQQHADFALGLSMLGELRFLQGDRAAAEGMFRRALSIRARVLGRSHPDFAVSLTCLAGMLSRRGALDEAERCLREALAIRYDALGPDHPESIQCRRELVRLLRQRGEWAQAQALSRPAHEQTGQECGVAAGVDLSEGLVILSSDLAKLGERLASAARLMNSVGAPPPARSIRELNDCRQRFDSLRGETLERVESLRVPNPPALELDTLQDLASVLDDLADAELQHREQEDLRLGALRVLDRVLALAYRNGEEFPPLRECQARAEQLRDTIESGHWLQLPAQTESLAEGTHALVDFLLLVEHRETLSDQDWADLHENVGELLGKPLALAASRGWLVVRDVPARRVAAPERTKAPAPPTGSTAPRPVVGPQPVAPEPALRQAPHSNSQNSLVRDLAVASLVPSMGTVIHLPTASPTELEAHRLLRVGQAPNVVERTGVHLGETGDLPTHANRGPVDGNERRQGGDRRAASTILAGPLPLLDSFGPAVEIRTRPGLPSASHFGSRERRDEPSSGLPGAVAPFFPGVERRLLGRRDGTPTPSH